MPSRILKNTSMYMLIGLMPSFVGIFMLPVYTRYMAPTDYGIVSLVMALNSLVMCFMGLRLAGSLNRFYFDYDEKDVDRFFSTILFSITAINLVLPLTLHIWGEGFVRIAFPRSEVPYRPYFMIGLAIIFFNSYVNYFNLMLRVQERALTLLRVSLVNTVLGVVSGVYFVVYRGLGAEGALAALAAVASFQAFVLFLILRSHVSVSFDRRMLKSALKYSLPIIPHAMGGMLFMYADKFVLGYYVPLASIGLYDFANRIAMILKLAVNSFNNANIPSFMRMSLASKEETVATYKRLITLWSVAVSFAFLGLAFFVEEVIHVLIPSRYHAAYSFVPILMGAYIFRGLYCFSINAVMYEKKTIVVPLVTFTAGTFNVAANILLIPQFGAIAAAWTTLLSFALTFLLALYFSNRFYPLEFEWGKIGRVFSVMLAVFLAVTSLKGENPWTNVFLKVAGVTIFGALLARWNYANVTGEIQEIFRGLKLKLSSDGGEAR